MVNRLRFAGYCLGTGTFFYYGNPVLGHQFQAPGKKTVHFHYGLQAVKKINAKTPLYFQAKTTGFSATGIKCTVP